MNLPELKDLSPELVEAEHRLERLNQNQEQSRANYRRLIEQKTNGRPPEDQEARVQAMLKGEPVPPPSNFDTEIANEQANHYAIEAAKEILTRRITELKRDAAKKLCAQVNPQYVSATKRLVAALVDVHSAQVELHKLKSALLNRGCGLYGIFDVDADFLDAPLDRASPLADFFREAKAAGFISSLPKELR